MGKGIIFILGVILIIMLVALFENGIEGLKNPNSYIQATQSIGDTGKDAFDKGKEIIGNIRQNSNSEASNSLKNFGLPLCNTNSSCNTLSECNIDLCSCINGECYK